MHLNVGHINKKKLMKIIYNYLFIIIETNTCIMSSSEAAPVPADAAPVSSDAAPVASDAPPVASDATLTPGPSMPPLSKPPLMRQNTGIVIPEHPHLNVDKKWLKRVLSEKSTQTSILKAQLQQKINEGDQDLILILIEIGHYPLN